MAKDFTWNGDKLKKDMTQATIGAVNETVDAAADKSRIRVRKNTGDLARSIGVRPAVATQDFVEAAVGAAEFYGIFEEIAQPYLRPSLDSETPQLTARIAKRLK